MNRRIGRLIKEIYQNGGFAVLVDNNRSFLEKQNAIRELIGRRPLKRANIDSLLFNEQELQEKLPEGYYLVWNESGDLLIMDKENYEKYEEI